jgi:hypothetical protein
MCRVTYLRPSIVVHPDREHDCLSEYSSGSRFRYGQAKSLSGDLVSPVSSVTGVPTLGVGAALTKEVVDSLGVPGDR